MALEGKTPRGIIITYCNQTDKSNVLYGSAPSISSTKCWQTQNDVKVDLSLPLQARSSLILTLPLKRRLADDGGMYLTIRHPLLTTGAPRLPTTVGPSNRGLGQLDIVDALLVSTEPSTTTTTTTTHISCGLWLSWGSL